MQSIVHLSLVFGAGLACVLSPCVLPVIPIVVTGTANDHKTRPLLVTIGLSIAFIGMGVATSLFGSAVAGSIYFIEKVAGVLIIAFGIMMLLDINLFKRLTFFQRFKTHSQGKFAGLILGFSLGIIWIPCIGPMLSSVLALVATEGKLLHGVTMLSIYAAGFSIPMLLAGYASQFFRSKVSSLRGSSSIIRYVSGSILVIFGVYIMLKGA
jgi:cytochrome c-type biogenesis protein